MSAPAGAAAQRWPLALGALATLALLATLMLGGALMLTASQSYWPGPASPQAFGVSATALADIPPDYLRLYQQAAQRYGPDWATLAAIGKVECDHGRDPDPSCTREGAENYAGAGGPMQFLASTWASYEVDANGDGSADRWDPADAIFAAARYLRASGAPGDAAAAIYAYNHDQSYVALVLQWAARYRSAAAAAGATAGGTVTAAPTALELTSGVRATLSPDDGHLALIPVGVPAQVALMLEAGDELQSERYGPQGHPDPFVAPAQDCSSTVNYVLARAGVRTRPQVVRENPLAQSYVDWGARGPGRWVTIYATLSPTPHVFIVIAGLRLDTSHNGTDVGPNRDQDGPRWRILGYIPTWAQWAVRHPPGL